jgi:hypothetical protein
MISLNQMICTLPKSDDYIIIISLFEKRSNLELKNDSKIKSLI